MPARHEADDVAQLRKLHDVALRPALESTLSLVPAERLEVRVAPHLDRSAASTLWEAAPTASVFNHPAWWQAALDCFGPRRQLLAISVYDQGELCAYWPFWEKPLGAKDAFVRVLEPVGARASDYLTPLVAPGRDVAAAIAATLTELETRLSPRTMILLSKGDDLPACDAAAHDAGSRGLLVHRQISPCPRMTLAENYAALEARWSRNHRSQVRRRIKRLSEIGEVSLHVARDRAEIRSRLPLLFEMHRANWQARGGGSEFDETANVRFVERLVEELPESLLHYSEVRTDDAPVSSHLGFLRGGDILWYKPAFDLSYGAYSPGMVHVALLARWGIENGFTALDFMQGAESYKFSWADETRETVSHAMAGIAGFPVWFWNAKVRKLIAELKT